MTRYVLPFCLALAAIHPLSGVAQDTVLTEILEPPKSVEGITEREIGAHMRFLVSDLMKGRDTASDEIRIAAEYLATRLEAAGAVPAGDDGGYFQHFPLEIVSPELEGTGLEIIMEAEGSRRVIPAQFGSDFLFFSRGVAPGEVEAPIVFVGRGRSNPEQGLDDFQGLPIANHFVLVLDSDEGRNGPSDGRSRRRDVSSLESIARQKGALGILVLRSDVDVRSAGTSPEDIRNAFTRSSLGLPRETESIPQIRLGSAFRDLLVSQEDVDPATARPRVLDGVRVRFRYAAKRELKHDRNVIGLFEGSDPERSKEVVIFSAHYDHVGVNAQGEIFNGSDDNASGTSALLEIAEAFGEGPKPARSIAFLWVSGEEKGLLGSSWFADHPSLPEGYRIVADINLDMISRNDGGKVGVTPSSKHAEHSTMTSEAVTAAQAEGLETVFNVDEYFHRTDSANFARKGIPVVFLFSDVHEDYHRPTDDVEKADFTKAAKIARAAFRLGWRIAQAEEPPKKLGPVAEAFADSQASNESE